MKKYDILVIGESMSGKSTYISSLMKKEVGEGLKSISKCNEEGQTKIPVHYLFKSSDEKFCIEKIQWDPERKGQNEEKDKEIIGKLKSFFPNVKLPLEDYFNSEDYKEDLAKIDVISFVKEVINDAKMEGTELIQHIEICVPASDKTKEEMIKHGLEELKIRDTRGFLDETVNKLSEMAKAIEERDKNNQYRIKEGFSGNDKEKQKKLIEKYLLERGMKGANATILIGKEGSNALNKRISKELYGDMLKELIKTGPLFTLIRTDRLSEILFDKEDLSYQEAIQKDENGKYKNFKIFTGNKDFRELLKYCGIEKTENEEIHSSVSKKYHEELLLANITIEEESNENLASWVDIYLKSVNGSLGKILELISHYKKDLEEVTSILKKIQEVNSNEIIGKLYEIYSKAFDSKIYYAEQIKRYEIKGMKYCNDYVAKKICNDYFGGIVGVRGGLTTRKLDGSMVGDVAIDLMEFGYDMKAEVFNQLFNYISPYIDFYAKKKHESEEKAKEFALGKKALLKSKFDIALSVGIHTRYCTYTMLSQSSFAVAIDKTKNAYGLEEGKSVSKCLPELENFKVDEQWFKDRNNISVIKTLIWYLIEDTMKYINWKSF